MKETVFGVFYRTLLRWFEKEPQPIETKEEIEDDIMEEDRRRYQINQWLHPLLSECIHKHLQLLGDGLYLDKYQINVRGKENSKLQIIHPTYTIIIDLDTSMEYSVWASIHSKGRDEILEILYTTHRSVNDIKWLVESPEWVNIFYSELSEFIAVLPQLTMERDAQRLDELKSEEHKRLEHEREYLYEIIMNKDEGE